VSNPELRPLTTGRATLLGVGAIIGGAPIVLAGAAFSAAGPAALLALALNGGLAILGALALSELGARFPRSGGPYLFAQRVLGLESAFAVGWLVLFGALLASAVFALGFASVALTTLGELYARLAPTATPPAGAPLEVGLALTVVLLCGARAYRRPRSAPTLLTIAKVVGMAGIGASGLVALGLRPEALGSGPAGLESALLPLFPGDPLEGLIGLAQAMGMLFIAFQGFVVLSANAGHLANPARTLPRASLATILIATALYLPLFLATATVGRPEGMTLDAFALASDTAMVALGALRTLGPLGFWWVAITALIAMLTALEANLAAATALTRTMARDGTLPRRLARRNPNGVPRRATLLTTAGALLLVALLPDVRTAGIAAGVIFLTVLALSQRLAWLLRRRSPREHLPYRAPGAPLIYLLGGTSALAVAVINALTLPAAGMTVLAWGLLGALVYIAALKTHARTLDAELEAAEPDVVSLRGRRPLVITPIANPANAEALISVAHALAPPEVGRVTVLHTLDPLAAAGPKGAQAVLEASLRAARGFAFAPEMLTTLAPDPWDEMARVARNLAGEALLLGLSRLDDEATLARLDALLAEVPSDVVVLRAPPGWHLERVRRVIVPFGGRADQERVRARVLGSLARLANPEVEVLQLLAADASAADCARSRSRLERLVEGRDLGRVRCHVEGTADRVATIAERSADADLLLLGLPKRDREGHALGAFAAAVAAQTPPSCALMLIHARG
jgi:basic amino acid/polyamine antiporter, APA family